MNVKGGLHKNGGGKQRMKGELNQSLIYMYKSDIKITTAA